MSCLYSAKPKLSVAFQKKNQNFEFAMAWFLALESTLLFKIESQNSWKTAKLSKMLYDNTTLTVQQFGRDTVSP